ncbi:MAG TPA: DUF507 family protein [Nitrospirae bacterium]|nr:hypothetical protein BMS3Bbin09_01652 [bacterium BMS3Bbin09]HDH34417.1 DUF507 family protein [Nitrospirota bacterium]HDO67605.1 DUF507 family protein [Nitrospirota bacterium]HDZ84683.1 DUF507 family protein [Nitrospirota bacterium]HEW81779.1 DUF507 family protein [Nitrospirota bacterium]
MRIPKGWVPGISKKILRDLLKNELVRLRDPNDQVVALIEKLLLEELMVEDRLNDEIKEMLRQYDAEIEKGQLDYQRLFNMTKQKILRERNIVI